MKILLFSDVHAGTSSDSTNHPGNIRLASTESLQTLEKNIAVWNTQTFDVAIQMGDILRQTKNDEINIQNIKNALSTFRTLQQPLIHILGNHEIRATSKESLHEFFTEAKLNDTFFGSQKTTDYKILWLETELNEEEQCFISDHQLQWLTTELQENIPTVIFSHYSIIPLNSQANFYFEKHPEAMHYQNYLQLVKVIESSNVVACFSAHCHWFSYKNQAGVHFITVPGFSENITAMNYPENNPGVYSTLEINDNKLLFKSFSKEFAFVNVELELE